MRRGFERGRPQQLGKQHLGGVVVQFAGDPLALVFLGFDHLDRQMTELRPGRAPVRPASELKVSTRRTRLGSLAGETGARAERSPAAPGPPAVPGSPAAGRQPAGRRSSPGRWRRSRLPRTRTPGRLPVRFLDRGRGDIGAGDRTDHHDRDVGEQHLEQQRHLAQPAAKNRPTRPRARWLPDQMLAARCQARSWGTAGIMLASIVGIREGNYVGQYIVV